MSITRYREQYKPFTLNKAWDYYKVVEQTYWRPELVPMSKDVQDFNLRISSREREAIAGILKGFTILECYIGDYWMDRVTKIIPLHEVKAGCYANALMEVVHSDAYSHLNDSLGLSDYEAFLSDAVIREKIDFFINHPNDRVSLAVFSGAGEGVSLFSSFAILLSFGKDGKFKGLSDIISWSIRDECLLNQLVLTENGWEMISEVNISNTKVAQYDMEKGEISYDYPIRRIEKYYEGDMVKFSSKYNKVELNVTANHDMVTRWSNTKSGYAKQKAIDVPCNPKKLLPISGVKGSGSLTNLSNSDRLKIAIQADGTVIQRSNISDTVRFKLTKKRKQERLEEILESLDIEYSKYNRGDSYHYNFIQPIEMGLLNAKYTFDWVNCTEITTEWAREFVNELLHWDGWFREEGKYIGQYGSTNPNTIEKVQEICIIAGYLAKPHWTSDNRKSTYKDYCKLSIIERNYLATGCLEKEVYPYKGKVYCLEMPKGTLITKTKNTTAVITGNCSHSDFGCYLFNQLVKEEKLIDRETDLIYKGFKEVVNNEIKFIRNRVFMGEDLPTIKERDAIDFIKYRGNDRLKAINLKPIFDLTGEYKNIQEWFGLESSGQVSNDFFNHQNEGGNYSSSLAQDFANFDYKVFKKYSKISKTLEVL